MAASQYLATQLVNWVRGTTMPAAPSTIYVGLFTAGGSEISGNGYSRIAIDAWGSVESGSGEMTVANSAIETTGTATADWSAVTQFRLYDASSSGNALSSLTALTTARTVTNGGRAEFAAGAFVFSVPTTTLGTYLATQICEWVSGITFPAAPTCYAGLYTAVPAEISGNGYSRGAVTWGTASDTGTAMRCRNSAVIETGTATSTWTQATGFVVFDASTSGNALGAVTALTSNVTITEGGFASVAVNGLSFTVPYAA